MHELGRRLSLRDLAVGCAVVAAYLLLNVVTQLAASFTANYDQAEILVLAQELRWGYTAQPPLYVWLSYLPDRFAGPSLALNLALKTGLLVACVGLSLGMLRRAGGSRRQALLVLAGFALVPVLVWESQRVLTHTTLALALVLAVTWQAQRLRAAAAPGAAGYLAWGMLAGAATLSKYNTVIALAALPAALLLLPGWRGLLLTRRLAWSAAGAALVMLPHFAWLAGNRLVLGSTVRKLESAEVPFAFVRGLQELAAALAACVGVMVLVWLLVRALAGLRRLPRALLSASASSASSVASDAAGLSCGADAVALRSLLAVQMLAGIALSAAFVVLTGTRHFEERWLLPVLAPLPLWLALSVRHVDLFRGLVTAAALLALVASALLPGRVLFAERMARGKPPVLSIPYEALAAGMRAAHGEPAWLIADTQTLGGNLRLVFPGARVLVPGVTAMSLPADATVWAVFEDTDCEGNALTERVDEQQMVPLADLACEVHEAVLLHHRARRHRLHLQVLPAGRLPDGLPAP